VISTGTEALDHRLGGLRPGGLYTFLGSATSGKSILGLHFLIDGLARGEHCLLVTNDEPAMLESRAAFVGAGIGVLTQNPHLRIVNIRDLESGAAGATSGPLGQLFRPRARESLPIRIVFDGIDAVPDFRRRPQSFIQELAQQLERTGATAYALLRTTTENEGLRAFAPVLDHSEGAFRLDVKGTGERRFQFLKQPRGALRTDEFQFNLRLGAGFIEELPLEQPQVTPAERQIVIVIDEIGVVPEEVISSIRQSYQLELLKSSAGELSRLSAGRYGTLIVAVDPFDESRAFDLVFTLRREGTSAPIVCAAPSRGLRSTTRSRLLRAGADDFFVTDMAPSEISERVQLAWQRGAYRRSGFSQIGQFMQPVRQDGSVRPMTRPEFLQAMSMLLAEKPLLFFCYLEFRVPSGSGDVVWNALRSRLRTGDGDLIGRVSDRYFGCMLDRITTEQTRRVMERIRSAHQDLGSADDVTILMSPAEATLIRAHLGLDAEATLDVPTR